jgi:hypothetical protein
MIDVTPKLKDIISEGVVVDIYKADQAISIFDEIGKASEVLNRDNFGNLFGSIQGYMTDQLILSLTKIYERPNKNYPTRSIPSALKFLEEHSEYIKIKESWFLDGKLSGLGISESQIRCMTENEKTRVLIKELRKNMPSVDPSNPEKLSKPMEALRDARDKKIAHNESISVEKLAHTTWEEIYPFLKFAKKAVGIIGISYLDIGYEVNDESYLPSSDAKRTGTALRRLFKKSGLVEDYRF